MSNFSISKFYCTECGNEGLPIVRTGRQREAGHLKNLYCYHCQKEVNHVEVRPFGKYDYRDFLEEYELGRFFDGKRIHVSKLMSCNNTTCLYNKHGKCWNSNYSYECPHRPHKTKEEVAKMYEERS